MVENKRQTLFRRLSFEGRSFLPACWTSGGGDQNGTNPSAKGQHRRLRFMSGLPHQSSNEPGHHIADAAATLVRRLSLSVLRTGLWSENVVKPTYVGERVIHPRKAKMSGASTSATDTPITLEMAIALRTVVFGNSTALSRPEWYRGEVALREAEKPLAFGLLSPRNVLKPVTACVQAHLIKQLLFEKRHLHHRPVATETLLQPSRMRQTEALAGALADIFWRCGDRKAATIVLPSEEVHIKECSTYVKDGVTELLTIHEFKKQDQLTQFLKRHLSSFTSENSPGHLLVLYGAVLSRGTSQVKADMQGFGNSLLTSQGEYTIPLLTLLLIGQATPFLHNGSVLMDSDENNYGKTKQGITCRGDIGLLHFKRTAEASWDIGSRAKTPYYPIWVALCNENFGVLFSPSRDLVRDYHAERNFVLHYVNMSINQLQPTALSIDTRYPKQQQSAEDMLNTPPLELLISTKWHSADVGWNGVTPFV